MSLGVDVFCGVARDRDGFCFDACEVSAVGERFDRPDRFEERHHRTPIDVVARRVLKGTRRTYAKTACVTPKGEVCRAA
jgi:hypothetical protein